MANLLADGVSFLHAQRKAHMSSAVVYRRSDDLGHDDVDISATIGRTEFEAQDESGMVTTVVSRDFIFDAADLVIGGVAVEPRVGDQVRETVGATVLIHEVAPFAGEKAWRWSDPHRVAYRVHTRQVGSEDAS